MTDPTEVVKSSRSRQIQAALNGVATSAERRRGQRGRNTHPATSEMDYQPKEINFMKAMDAYQKKSGRRFPTWSEVLAVVEDLGYKLDPKSE